MSAGRAGQREFKPDFKRKAALAVHDKHLRETFDRCTRRQDVGRRAALPELGDPLAVRNLAARIKNHTLQNLDRYLEQLIDNVEKLGGQVHFAETGEQACAIVTDIARRTGSKSIVKGKSMVSEEIELDDALEAAGLDVVETDLGEYILQLSREKPCHIVTPAIHMTKEGVGRLFAEKLGIDYTNDPESLTAAARTVLREKFQHADMGMTGANFAVAETGSICIVTNEGNGRFCSSRPRVLVTMMGIEKVIPRMKDLSVFLKLLSKSATGQRMTCYTSLINGPKRPDDFDGPEEFHLVIIDKNRTKILASDYRETLRCIRCGACLNACPVYRTIGGHTYESVYPGPIGKLITPMLRCLETYEHLPQASTLCHACFEACPARIDTPRMLIEMRYELRKRGRMPWLYRIGFKFWRIGMNSKFLYHWGAKFYHWSMDLFAREGWHRRLFGPAAEWTNQRDFPALADRPFHDRWAKLEAELDAMERQTKEK